MEVTLLELLDSREDRVRHQKELLDKYQGTLISVTLNIPGPIKDKPQYRQVLEWGMERLKEKFDNIVFSEIRYLKTGSEGYICLKNDTDSIDVIKEIKTKTVEVETLDDRARLLDIDVISIGGVISRSELGLPPRKCLICDGDAKACARSQKHKMEELLARVEELCI